MMIYGWREREEVLRFFQKVTGLRMNHNYVRPGGVAADLPAGLARRRAAAARPDPAAARRVRHADDRPADLARAAAGRRRDHADRGHGARRDRPGAALDRRRLGPPPGHAVPALPRGRVRRDRRHVRRRLRPLRHPPQRGARVDAHRPPGARPHAAGRLPHPGQEGHAAAAGPHRRVDGGADPPLQAVHRGLQGARGRGLRRRREPPRRARLLHRQRRLGQAVPDAHAGAVVRQHPVPAAHDARRPRRRRRGRSSPPSTRCSGTSTDDAACSRVLAVAARRRRRRLRR